MAKQAGRSSRCDQARVGGIGHTFSASPLAIGNRLLFLDEEGTTIIVEPGATLVNPS